MISVIRRLFTLSLIALIALAPLYALGEAQAFTPQDMTIDAAGAGTAPDEVALSLGDPVSRESSTEAATGVNKDTWQYEGLSLVFTDGTLSGADWTNPAHIGPKGLRIGDSLDTVKSAFRVDATQATPNVLYTSGWVEALQTQLPPCGTVSESGDGSLRVTYLAPMDPYGMDVQDNPASFVYQNHAALVFTLSADTQTVTRIGWSVGALAE